MAGDPHTDTQDVPGRVFAAEFSADGKRFVVGSSSDRTGEVRVYDSAEGKLVAKCEGQQGPVYAVSFRRDGREVASSGFDGLIRLNDPETGKLIKEFKAAPLTTEVARDCLIGWYGENRPGRGVWEVAGEAMRPERLEVPSLVVAPGADRIVPPLTARALADRIPGAERLDPQAGHIGMVVGAGSVRLMWEPVRRWIAARAAGDRRRKRPRRA